MSRFYQGYFKPRNPDKCINIRAGKDIRYRSSWEHKFMVYLDTNENVIQWGSELFSIPYIHPADNKTHNYWPDFIMEVKQSDGKIIKYCVEIKPKNQSELIDNRKRKTKKNEARMIAEAAIVAVNKKKWESCKNFCENNGLIFKVITEDHLF